MKSSIPLVVACFLGSSIAVPIDAKSLNRVTAEDVEKAISRFSALVEQRHKLDKTFDKLEIAPTLLRSNSKHRQQANQGRRTPKKHVNTPSLNRPDADPVSTVFGSADGLLKGGGAPHGSVKGGVTASLGGLTGSVAVGAAVTTPSGGSGLTRLVGIEDATTGSPTMRAGGSSGVLDLPLDTASRVLGAAAADTIKDPGNLPADLEAVNDLDNILGLPIPQAGTLLGSGVDGARPGSIDDGSENILGEGSSTAASRDPHATAFWGLPLELIDRIKNNLNILPLQDHSDSPLSLGPIDPVDSLMGTIPNLKKNILGGAAMKGQALGGDRVVEGATDAVNNLPEVTSKTKGGVANGVVKNTLQVSDAVANGATDAMNKVANNAADATNRIADEAGQTLDGAGDHLVSATFQTSDAVTNGAIDAGNSVAEGVMQTTDMVNDGVTDASRATDSGIHTVVDAMSNASKFDVLGNHTPESTDAGIKDGSVDGLTDDSTGGPVNGSTGLEGTAGSVVMKGDTEEDLTERPTDGTTEAHPDSPEEEAAGLITGKPIDGATDGLAGKIIKGVAGELTDGPTASLTNGATRGITRGLIGRLP